MGMTPDDIRRIRQWGLQTVTLAASLSNAVHAKDGLEKARIYRAKEESDTITKHLWEAAVAQERLPAQSAEEFVRRVLNWSAERVRRPETPKANDHRQT